MNPNTLHVGLNASLLSLDENYRGAGISWYIHNLLCHLPAADPTLRYTAFLHDTQFSPPRGMQVSGIPWPTHSPIQRILWEQAVAPAVLRRKKMDVFHAMAFVSPVLSRLPTVVTVLDLSFLLFPKAFTLVKRLYLQLMTRLSVRRAKQVIAISEHTRQDLIAHLGVPGDRVQTVYCGVDAAFRPLPPAHVEAFRLQKGLPQRFVLFLGTLQPRKNIVRLIEAFARLVDEITDLHLVIAGGKGWFFEPIFARVNALGLQGRVHFPGYVPEEEKALWYNAATCFCFPSLYEGFGLPPLEAMACGTPVVTSNVASLPEVVGDAGVTVPPQDVHALSAALRRVLTQADLRAALTEKGVAQATRFSWHHAACQTASIYRQVGQEKTR